MIKATSTIKIWKACEKNPPVISKLYCYKLKMASMRTICTEIKQ